MKWPLARVIELLFGEDGVARVAVLKTASGVTKRAVNNLCLLPFKDDVETQASNGGSMSGHAAAAANLLNSISYINCIAKGNSLYLALSFFVYLHSLAQHSVCCPFEKIVRILISTLNALSSRLMYSLSLINC